MDKGTISPNARKARYNTKTGPLDNYFHARKINTNSGRTSGRNDQEHSPMAAINDRRRFYERKGLFGISRQDLIKIQQQYDRDLYELIRRIEKTRQIISK